MMLNQNRSRTISAALFFTFIGLAACEQQGVDAPGPAVTVAQPTRGANWRALEAIKKPSNAFVVEALLEREVALGDTMEFKVRSARDGFLHIVQVDSQDSVTALLPNGAVSDNRIVAGQELTFPPAGTNLKIRAQEPTGASLLAFAVTREKLPTEQVFPELFGKPQSEGLAVVGSSNTGVSPWSIARYTVNVANRDLK
ncbi:MAG: DUF4384 domain-containing protein [Pseudomonadota bacterium]